MQPLQNARRKRLAYPRRPQALPLLNQQQRLQRVRDVNPRRRLLVLDFWSHANNKRSWFDKLL
jgi:hypothetical protein